MDDKFGHWNWLKLVRLGTLLAKKYTNALVQSATHADEFDALCVGVSPDTVNLWTERILNWEGDRSQPNPYFNPSSGPSELEIRHRLTLEEEKDDTSSTAVDPSDDFTETKYLLYGLDLEQRQYKLQSVLASATSGLLPTSIVELRTTFRRRLVKFHQLQTQYQPETIPLLARLPSTCQDPDSVHEIPLFLPSSLPPEALRKCSQQLISMEKELRIGQCRDSLVQLRTKLTAQARLLKHKFVHIRHQGLNTRSHGLLKRNSTKIEAIAARYSHGFATLEVLDSSNGSEWRSEFKELRKQDIRCFSEAELPSAPTQERAEVLRARVLLNGGAAPEGNRMVSWIWRGSLKGGSEYQGEEFRLEWSKAYARRSRWNEEVMLLAEEMRRILESLKWKSKNWLQKGDDQVISLLTTCPFQLEGLRAYAHRQAHVFSNLLNHFLGIWTGLELPRKHLSEPFHPADLSLDVMELDGDDI
ncbi:hypothetical protein BJ322DRAFT_1114826 [Thelephora terrestris]|uniref:Uncharacterized protein n=1 Tax=Thelephora terrestris TaxID=56493 RepID=A0A9P6H1U3_9AGAM|nr:hypothetical protein BJ322DRAFT_1114826 [Thelephora terrestris]